MPHRNVYERGNEWAFIKYCVREMSGCTYPLLSNTQ